MLAVDLGIQGHGEADEFAHLAQFVVEPVLSGTGDVAVEHPQQGFGGWLLFEQYRLAVPNYLVRALLGQPIVLQLRRTLLEAATQAGGNGG